MPVPLVYRTWVQAQQPQQVRALCAAMRKQRGCEGDEAGWPAKRATPRGAAGRQHREGGGGGRGVKRVHSFVLGWGGHSTRHGNTDGTHSSVVRVGGESSGAGQGIARQGTSNATRGRRAHRPWGRGARGAPAGARRATACQTSCPRRPPPVPGPPGCRTRSGCPRLRSRGARKQGGGGEPPQRAACCGWACAAPAAPVHMAPVPPSAAGASGAQLTPRHRRGGPLHRRRRAGRRLARLLHYRAHLRGAAGRQQAPLAQGPRRRWRARPPCLRAGGAPALRCTCSGCMHAQAGAGARRAPRSAPLPTAGSPGSRALLCR